MREMLEPIFGESGAVVAQFIITLIVLLALIGLGYWLFRRLAGASFKGTGRGRIPRLAIIDALSVDSRRKLVLVRRDNVEHLILIGGTSDLVVEPSIVRSAPAGARPRQGQAPRPQPQPQPPAQPQAQAKPQPSAAETPSAPPQLAAMQRRNETGISEPIPFPQAQRPQPRPAARGLDAHRAQQERSETATSESTQARRTAVRPSPAAVEPVRPVGNGERGAVASARFEEPSRPSRVESVLSLAETLDEIADEPNSSSGATTEFSGPRARPAPTIRPSSERATAEAKDVATARAVEPGARPLPATTPGAAPAGEDQGPEEEASTAKVSDLEREMARLLGEITAKRD